MLKPHIINILNGCRLSTEGRSDSLEIVAKNGSVFANISLFSTICQPWIRDALKTMEILYAQGFELVVMMPDMQVEDLNVFFSSLCDTKYSPSLQDRLECAVSNLCHFFRLELLLVSDLDDETTNVESENSDSIMEGERLNLAETDWERLSDATISENFTDQDGRLVCLVCFKIFNGDRLQSFKQHLKLHQDSKLLGKYLESFDKANKPKKCPKCTYVCQSFAQLNAHSRVHTEKTFSCATCTREFQSEKILQNHIKSGTCHTRSRQCQLCKKVFCDTTRLKNHVKTHTGEKPWGCQVCLKSFSELRSLKEHKQTHKETRDHRCHQCEKTFVQKNHLLYHLASKHGTGERLHKCCHCPKSFAFGFQLKRHNLTHQPK